MLWTIFVLLLILWLLGLVSSYTLGGFIHILLVVALVVLIFQLLSGRRTVVYGASDSLLLDRIIYISDRGLITSLSAAPRVFSH